MKGQFNSIFKLDLELELIEVDRDVRRLGIPGHFALPRNFLKLHEIPSGREVVKKM